MKNDCGEFPLRIFETTVLIFPSFPFSQLGTCRLSIFSLQSYPCTGDRLCSLRSNVVRVEGSGYSSQLMKKLSLQSFLVFQFSQEDPHPVKIILKFTLLMGAPGKKDFFLSLNIKFEKSQLLAAWKNALQDLEERQT